jgi:hypothetical protein
VAPLSRRRLLVSNPHQEGRKPLCSKSRNAASQRKGNPNTTSRSRGGKSGPGSELLRAGGFVQTRTQAGYLAARGVAMDRALAGGLLQGSSGLAQAFGSAVIATVDGFGGGFHRVANA